MVWFVYTSWLILGFGLPTALTRYIPLFSLEQVIILIAKPLSLLITISFASVYCFTVYLLFVGETVFVLLLFFTIAISMIITAILAGLFLSRTHFLGSSIAAVVTLLICYPLIKNTNIEGYYISITLYFLVYSIYGIIILSKYSKNLSNNYNTKKINVKEFVQYSLSLWVVSLVSALLWQRTEIALIQTFLSSEDVGYFSAGFMMSNVFIQLSVVIVVALLPHFSIHHAKENIVPLATIYALHIKLIGWISLFVTSFFIINAHWIIKHLFGEQYFEGMVTCVLIMISMPIASIGTVGSTILKGTGKVKILFVSNIIGVVIAVPLYFYALQFYHLEEMLFARIFVLLMVIIIEATYIYKTLHYTVPIFHLITFSFISYLNVLIVFSFNENSSTILFAILTVISFFLYIFFTLIFRLFTLQDIRQFMTIESITNE